MSERSGRDIPYDVGGGPSYPWVPEIGRGHVAPVPPSAPDLPVAASWGGPAGPPDLGPRNYTRPDEFILDDVARTLASDPAVDAFNLEVDCASGVVAISGRVRENTAKQRIEVLVASVLGVVDISMENLQVSKGVLPPQELETNDAEGKEEAPRQVTDQ
jgi:hypothetical protein